VNSIQRRRSVAALGALARGSDTGLEDGPPCDCAVCRLLHAGACLPCATLVVAAIIHGEGTINVCSGTCREAIERVFPPPTAPAAGE
jgi:hypothetical protein